MKRSVVGEEKLRGFSLDVCLQMGRRTATPKCTYQTQVTQIDIDLLCVTQHQMTKDECGIRRIHTQHKDRSMTTRRAAPHNKGLMILFNDPGTSKWQQKEEPAHLTQNALSPHTVSF